MVGTELSDRLRELGHAVTRITRSRELARAADTVRWDPAGGEIDAPALAGHDVVINLAGEPIAGLWTAARKRRILTSRVDGTALLARTIAALEPRPRAYIVASGMNWYGAGQSNQPKTEAAPRGAGFLADVVAAWEAAADPARGAGIRVLHLRSGHVLDARGGLLGSMLPMFRLGLGVRLGNGRQYWSWVANAEIPYIILHLSEHETIAGPVNVCTPNSVTNAEFTETLARVLGRPAFLRVPAFIARLAPGGMGEEALLAGTRMVPARLIESGYEFRWPMLEPALRKALEP